MGLFDMFKKTHTYELSTKKEQATQHPKIATIETKNRSTDDGLRFCNDYTTPSKTEPEIIKAELTEVISKYNEQNPHNKINLDNVFIGELVESPGCVGCFYKPDGWYLYTVDEKYFTLMGNGPFSLNGIITALCYHLYIPSTIRTRSFNEAEHELYLNGEKPM